MLKMLGLLSLLLFCLMGRHTTEGTLQEDVTGEVVFVNVIFRHGDINIVKAYANDPNKNSSNWPEGLGQLTNVGKRQEFALGQWLRRRYDGRLTYQYCPDLVDVRSTDVDRTLMSAKCVLAGMFPPTGKQVWNDNLAWQPIPTHTVPEVLDKTEQTSSLNVHMYSAHDITIVNLLNTLGLYDLRIPPYAATVMMELRTGAEGSHHVTLYYRNSTTDDPFLLTVPGCAPVCPLDQLINLTLPVIPEDCDRECPVLDQ